MGMQILFKAKALSPGADLWIVPEPLQSPEVRKLDWYLNFQLARTLHHKPQTLSADLKNLLLQNELPELKFGEGQAGQQACLISAENFLPTRMVLMLPLKKPFEHWLKQAQLLWTNLGKPNVRVFLPTEIEADEIRDLWPQPNGQTQLSVVPT